MTIEGRPIQVVTKKFLTMVVLIYVSAASLGMLLSSYMGLRTTETLIFSANDGWCNAATEGIGVHCFGDFAAALKLDFATPWTYNPVAYPPLSLAYFKPFALVFSQIPNENFVLLFNLALMLCALLFPAVHLFLTGRVTSGLLAMAIGVFTVCSAPGLMSIDRGNNQIFIMPILYLFYVSIMSKKYSQAVLYGILMTLWRPQMALVGIIFLVLRDWKSAGKWAVGSVVGTLLSFGLFPWSQYAVNLKAWVVNLFGYETIQSLPAYFPTNWSFANFVAIVGNLFSSILHGHLPSPDYNFVFPTKYISAISMGFLIICILVQMGFGRKKSTFQNLIIASSLAILVPGVTFSYYLSILLVPAIFIVASIDSSFDPTKYTQSAERNEIIVGVQSLFKGKLNRSLLYATSISILVPWPISWRLIGVVTDKDSSNIGVNWIFGNIFLVLWFLNLLFGNIRNSTREHSAF